MNVAHLDGVSYWYPRADSPALDDVTLDITPGEFTLLAGPSGGGKSTLLRLFNGLVPQFHGGRLSGMVEVAGFEPARTPAREMALTAGMVFQEPEAQAVTETVEEEAAFGMEQQGIPRPEMRARMARVLEDLGIEHLRHRRLITLSGGERQRVAIASILVLEPKLLLLDEPTSQLDGAGSESFFAALRRLRASRDVAMLIAEHRLDRLLPAVHRVIGVSAGRAAAMTPREAAARLESVPPVCELSRGLRLSPLPLSVEEALGRFAGARARAMPRIASTPGDALIEASALTVAYGEHVALKDASLKIHEGEVIALIGANGSGKSTLFRAMSGLSKPARGEVRFPGLSRRPRTVREITAFAGLVPQDPALALYRESVRDEIAESLGHRQGTRPAKLEIETTLRRWHIDDLADRNPRDISVGQQQRVAIGAMLAHHPKVWLLDEPTRGADGAAKAWLAGCLTEHASTGGAAVVATHDLESAARFATRVIELRGGEVVLDAPVHAAFGAAGPHPTQVARLVPGALTVEEVEGA